MNRPQIDARIRAMQQPSITRAAPPPQMTPNERSTTMQQTAGGRTPPPIRQTGQFARPAGAPPTQRGGGQLPGRVAPESVGAIALPRPPVQAPIGSGTGGMSRPPVSQRTEPMPQGTVRTTGSIARKTGSLPPTPSYGSQPPPRSAEPPPLDDLVPRSRSERPRHSRPPVSHRSQPPRDRPRFIDRSPDPRPPGGGLPGPDSFGRIPAPIPRYDAKPDFPSPSNFPPPSAFPSPSNFPPPNNNNPEETMAMARGPYAAPPQPRMQTAEYYPQQQSPHQQARSYPPPSVEPRRDPNEYYPHLRSPSQAPPPHMYPPPGYLPPGSPHQRTMPANAMGSGAIGAISGSAYPPALAKPESRLPLPGSAPYPYVAPPIENPSFMGLVLFAAPLALATLAVAALALM